jgi:hypothetical protein
MKSNLFTCVMVLLCLGVFLSGVPAQADNSHWSRQFPKPKTSTKMTGETGMSDGNGSPNTEKALWHKGKLYMAGNWKCGINPDDPSKRDVNIHWRMWTWHPKDGYTPVVWQHSARGGDGPDGVINDFCFLPDGRLVVVGEFNKIHNVHGHNYHRSNGLAVFNPEEATANRWQPLVKSVQHNAPRGGLMTVAYDPNGNDIWIGGSFSGFRMDPQKRSDYCYGVQRFDLDDNKWYIIPPGLRNGRGVYKIKVDSSSNPSTIYMAGRFSNTGGNGESARDSGTDRYTEGFCAWNADKGYITFPKNHVDGKIHKQGVLQRAADYAYFDSVNVFDFLVDGKDIYIVGAFSEGTINNGKPLRGIAKWDDAAQMWVDPTGKGGFGREVYSIAKTDDGKIYVAGAFGGEKSGGHYDGFKDGSPAYMAACYDPAAGTWTGLGDGLGGYSMPVCRLTATGNDVLFVGTFKQVGRNPKKDGFESYYIARWNAHHDFTKGTPPIAGQDTAESITVPESDQSMIASGLEHWSRKFKAPERQKARKTQQSATTGMDRGVGTPDIAAMKWHNGTLYIAGSWEVMMNERWFVWTYHPENGWKRLGYTEKNKAHGFATIPEGLKWHDGKLYVYGSSEQWKGIAVYDPGTEQWAEFTGTYKGKPIKGNGAQGNPPINDIAWDSKTGDMYLVGACGENIRYDTGEHPSGKTVPSQVLKVDKNGVYHALGLMLSAQDPNKPELSVNCILIDETKTPSDLYIGGTFGYWGMTSDHKNAVYNIAKWDSTTNDWGAIGKGNFWRIGMHDKKTFPEGYPGLKGQPIYGFPTFLRELWGKVRCLAMDKAGNLYAGGAIGILDDNSNINLRDEHYGLVKYDKAQDKWVGATSCRGVSRDVFQMTWLDEKKMLISGGFLYSEDYGLLNNIAIFDTVAGTLEPLGGGVLKGTDAHVVSCNVVHDVADDGYWFGGFFQYAGSEPKFLSDAPVESYSIAHYNPGANLDPNANLKVDANVGVEGVTGFSSKSRKLTLTASCSDGEVIWFEKSTTGKFKEKAKGNSFSTNIRVKAGMKQVIYYVSVRKPDGTEGGKLPVVVKVSAPK